MVRIMFSTSNDAFQGEAGREEIDTILNKIAYQILIGQVGGQVVDSNGNTVGGWSWTKGV